MGLSVQKGPRRGPRGPQGSYPNQGVPSSERPFLCPSGGPLGQPSPTGVPLGPSRTAPGPILVPAIGEGQEGKPNHLESGLLPPHGQGTSVNKSASQGRRTRRPRKGCGKRAWVSYRHLAGRETQAGTVIHSSTASGMGQPAGGGRRGLSRGVWSCLSLAEGRDGGREPRPEYIQ